MAIVYDWTIPTCEHDIATGGINVVHWRCTATDVDGETTYSASAYGTCGFQPDASAPDFIAYADLTEADVLGWVWQSVGKAETEARLADNIAEQKAPATEAGMPW